MRLGMVRIIIGEVEELRVYMYVSREGFDQVRYTCPYPLENNVLNTMSIPLSMTVISNDVNTQRVVIQVYLGTLVGVMKSLPASSLLNAYTWNRKLFTYQLVLLLETP